MPTTIQDCRARWENRVRRARELQDQHAAIANGLRLYHEVLEFQADLACQFRQTIQPDIPLRQQIDLDAICSIMPSILALSAERGPDPLRFEAYKVRQAGQDRWRQMLAEVISGRESVSIAAHDFFARACLQPIAENLQRQLPLDPNYGRNVCPACGGLPQMAVLRPEGEGASRWMLCSFCLCEWPFRRILCPWCGEEDKEKLPHYTSESWTYVHVEACDNCQHYFKAVDMTVNGLAVPLVDEAALAVLDVWASGLGYTKIIRNLIGF